MATSQQTQGVIVTPVTATGIQLVPNVSTGSLSLTGIPNDGDKFTVTIDATAYAYTFKTALTPTAGEVLIGGSAAAAILNLFNSMTGGPGGGTTYVALAAGPSANSANATVLGVNLSGQWPMRALAPTPGNVIALYNGVGYAYTLALTTNTSGFLAKSDFAAASVARAGYLHIVNVRPNTAGATLQLYDSAQVTGTPSGNTLSFLDAQTGWSNFIDYNGRKVFVKGLYGVLTSAGSVGSFEVTYE